MIPASLYQAIYINLLFILTVLYALSFQNMTFQSIYRGRDNYGSALFLSIVLILFLGLRPVSYHFGDTVTEPQIPTRAADNTYTYAFAGWNTSISTTCDGTKEYKATYTPTYIEYTVVFKDYNGDVISSKEYHYGDTVTVLETVSVDGTLWGRVDKGWICMEYVK